MLNFTYDILRQRVNLKMTMKFLERIYIYVLSWTRDLTKRDCNLKTTQIHIIPLSTSFLGKLCTLSQNFNT